MDGGDSEKGFFASVGRMNTSETLLKEVLSTCRGKSNVLIEDWKKLRRTIEDHLNGLEPDVELYRDKRYVHVKKFIGRKSELESIAKESRAKLKKAQELIKIYQAREADIMRVLRSNISKREVGDGHSQEIDS